MSVVVMMALAALITLLSATSAVAAGPEWRLQAIAPDGIIDNKPVTIVGWVSNVGDVPMSGSLTITHTFPVGIAPVEPQVRGGLGSSCQIVSQTSLCDIDVKGLVPGSDVRVIYNNAPVSGASGTLLDTIDAAGGGMASGQIVQQSMTVGEFPPFAFKQFALDVSAMDRSPAEQAGSTPRELESTILLRSVATDQLGIGFQALIAPTEHLRDAVAHVPAGFIGNPNAVAKCTLGELAEPSPLTSGQRIPNCPQDSQVGYVRIMAGLAPDEVPLYSLTPPVGSPAAFGFHYQALTIILTARLRPTDNGIDLVSSKAISSLPLAAVWVTMWGTPAEPSHDTLRHLCMDGFEGNFEGKSCPSDAQPTPFLRMPTSCSNGPLPWSVDLTSYEHPSTDIHADTTSAPVTGCGLLPFDPELALLPTSLTAHGPTGLDATLTLPQDVSSGGLAEADLRTATVTLPEGMTINPSSADGLQACTDAELKLGQEGPSSCPDGAKIGTIALRTPLLDHPLGGAVFLRTQNSNDPLSGEQYRIAVEIRSDDDGIDIKLPAAVKADPVTGRLTTTFDDLPQLPFESMTLHLKTGPRAPLTTPRACGTYSTHAQLSSWSGKTVASDSPFTISADGNGAPCPAPSFAPALKAGTTTPIAGAFSAFALQLTRSDEDGQLGALNELHLPRGLLADAASVSVRCSDAEATAAACPAASRIGSVTVGAGAGSNPFYVSGDVYLMGQQTAGPFTGDPFGLAVVVHALAGPFDLGYVVVRAGIEIHSDGSVTTRSEPFPSILQGIPLQLRDIRVRLDRPGFMLNPTSCAPQAISGTVSSLQGQTAAVGSRFQVGECSALAFKPDFKATTESRTSRANGAALRVHLATDEGPGDTAREANIARVDVQIPAILPSRLSTLQKACTAAQFDVDPAACPEASFVGTAVAHTPILSSALSGPAILVSHGGGAFPDVVLVLQGEGVRIDLTGHTQIKHGITFSHFETVPDAPVSSFDLTLPEGPHSVLTVDQPGVRNLCVDSKTVTRSRRVTRRVKGHTRKVTVRVKKTVSTPLSMPTTITAQNGAVLRQTTEIAVTGCPVANASRKSKKASRHKH